MRSPQVTHSPYVRVVDARQRAFDVVDGLARGRRQGEVALALDADRVALARLLVELGVALFAFGRQRLGLGLQLVGLAPVPAALLLQALAQLRERARRERRRQLLRRRLRSGRRRDLDRLRLRRRDRGRLRRLLRRSRRPSLRARPSPSWRAPWRRSTPSALVAFALVGAFALALGFVATGRLAFALVAVALFAGFAAAFGLGRGSVWPRSSRHSPTRASPCPPCPPWRPAPLRRRPSASPWGRLWLWCSRASPSPSQPFAGRGFDASRGVRASADRQSRKAPDCSVRYGTRRSSSAAVEDHRQPGRRHRSGDSDQPEALQP